MSTAEIQIQEHRTRLYKHANRPVPLQNIRLNIADQQNPYHRVIRGNTYNLRTTSSGIVRLTNQAPQYQPLFFEQNRLPPEQQRPSPQKLNFAASHINQTYPTKLVSKRQHVKNMRRTRIMSPSEDRYLGQHHHHNRKTVPIQTDETEIIELRPEVDAEVQTDQVTESVHYGGQYREASGQSLGVDKSTQVSQDDPEIFVFDREVQEILEKLIGTTLVQCMGEVLEEEEISSITRQNKHHKVKTSVLLNDRPL